MDILGIKIDNTDMEKALEKACDALSDRASFRYIFTPNAEICMAAIKDNSLMEVLNSSFMNILTETELFLLQKFLRLP